MGAFDDLIPRKTGAFDDLIPQTPQTAAAPASKIPAAASSPIGDIAKSGASGVGRGLVETIMLPATANRLASGGMDWLVGKGDDLVRSIFGLGPASAETKALQDRARAENAGAVISNTVNSAQASVRSGMDAALHKPETTAGEYARTVGEFAPSLLVGGPGSAGARFVGDVLIPAIFSETAGQATKGTAAEPYARFVGGAAGNLATATVRARASAPERVVGSALENVPPAQLDEAAALQARAAAAGVPLSGPEAIQAATNGATKLGDVQRVVEGSTAGGARTSPFYAERPQQVQDAVGRTLDTIAPASPNPSTLGPRASETATDLIRGVERQRTAAVDPIYARANADTVPADAVHAIIAQIDNIARGDRTGILSGPLAELRNRIIATPAQPGSPAGRQPVHGPTGQVVRYEMTPAVDPTPAVPITDVENLDRARKYFRDRMDLPQIGADAITKEQNAAVSSILQQLDNLMEQHSRNFVAGKQAYADLSRDLVQPVAAGPLGQVAAAGNTAAASRAVLPPRPLAGGDAELIDTITRMSSRDPELTAGLVRQRLADQFDQSSGRLVGGENQYGGARFAKDIAGTPQQEANLRGVVGALPNGATAEPAVSDMVDILRATGMRKPQGSATEFNRQIADDLGAVPVAIGGATTVGTALPRIAGDAVRRAWYGRGANRLADLFLAPDSVDQMRAIAARGGETPFMDALRRQLVQSPSLQ
ncbi:MAG: hypothetical protein J0I54_01575 [Bosea sp.]|uniref:hypothetical protein n=1 Tax=unclassified Bosea (in: a-proteobacteria) TaxID=2653178 RepID=UPI000961F98B|nr:MULTISPECIES: hypothetical protein [unclassified Bosea (in: a-proteobacteria)]MBN9455294.1 hypothetical protein [Bosea sp. (in: a-proteobacteria)]OJV04919.1 MAG: hypothetical protein BGO20_17365 [Bosea sp. 67-29]